MKRQSQNKIKSVLLEKRKQIILNAEQTLKTDMKLDISDLPDAMDLATSEYLLSFQFRLRGREQRFLFKIDKALARISDGSFGTCEDCENDIHPKRLEARPETTLCIRCKEEQEQRERI